MDSGLDSDMPGDIPGKDHDTGNRSPVIELVGDGLDDVAHPFDAAERVLAAVA